MENWYMSKIIFRIVVGNGDHNAQFEEQVRLIKARNEEEAFLKARMIGGRGEESFLNASLNTVRWEFIDISDLVLLPELSDGMELCSRIYEEENVEEFVAFTHSRANKIAKKIPTAIHG